MARSLTSALFLLCLAWLLPGLIGHAPWKGVDASNFVRFLALWQQGDWLLPGLEETFPPLYSWVAAVTAWLSSPFLALHDGARLASGVFLALALFFTARAAHALYGADHRWPAALALLGSVGLLLRGHEMNAYTAQLAGVAIMLDGLARLPQQSRQGWTVAAGLSLMLLATGLIEPLALALLAVMLPLLSPAYRSPLAVRGLALGLLVAIAVGLIWVGVLRYRDEALAAALQLQRWPARASPGDQIKPSYVIGVASWYLWPTWPLAIWALYRMRRNWREPASLLPLWGLLVLFAVFSVSINPGEDKLLALTMPSALLASAGAMSLRRGAAYAFLWFSVMLFGFLGLVFWVYWSAHDLGFPARLARRLVKLGIEDVGQLRVLPFVIGLILTATWVIFLARLERTPYRPLLVWSAGITFIWVLLLTFFLEVFDARLSYARIGEVLKKQVPATTCINVRGMGPQARTLLAYHSERDLRAFPVTECNWLVVQRKRGQPAPKLAAHWVVKKEIVRPGDRDNYFQLYARRL